MTSFSLNGIKNGMSMYISKKLISVSCSVSILLLTAGCSSVTHSSYAQKAGLFPDREILYMQGKSLPPLKMPAGVSSIPNDPYYDIPELSNNTITPISIMPPKITTPDSPSI